MTHLGLPECTDMRYDSEFMTQLNKEYEVNPKVDTLAIVGKCNGCETQGQSGDEVVRIESASLNGAKNVVIDGDLVSGSGTFHQDLVRNPKVYNEIMSFI